MIPTSRPTSTRTANWGAAGDVLLNRAWFRHGFFATGYLIAVIISASAVYSGTFISIVWPSVGIAVWWAATCRSTQSFLFTCVFVFIIPVLTSLLSDGRSFISVALMGVAHVIAGPGVTPVMAWLERMHPSVRKVIELRNFMLLDRIAVPRDVYRLLIASLIMVPISKCISLLGIGIDGGEVSILLYLSLILRDLAGIIAVAGPGLAIFSSIRRGVNPGAIREFIGMVVVTSVLLTLIFGPGQDLPIVYLALLPLYWSATRLPVVMATMHAVFTATLATVLAYLIGANPFAATDTPMAQASAVQLFILLAILLSLVVSTTIQQHSALSRKLEAVTTTIPDALLTINRHGQAVPVNTAAHDVVDTAQDGTMIARPLRGIDGITLSDTKDPGQRALQGESVKGVLVELSGESGDKENSVKRFYSVSASPLYGPGESDPGHALLLYHDSTDAHQTLQLLQNAYQEALVLFEHAPQGVAVLDSSGTILQANSALGDLLLVPPAQLAGTRLDDFDDEGDLTLEISSAIEKPGKLVQADRYFRTDDGQHTRVALAFRTMDSGDAMSPLLLVNVVDITERQKLYELVSHLADHDPLTGLFNRRRLDLEFERMLEKDSPEETDDAVLLVDLDNFKAVNDTLGHKAGDELLVEFAGLLKETVRSTDIIARSGGDEFAILLPDITRDAANAICKSIVETVNKRFGERPGILGRVTASIGMAMFSEARDYGTDPMGLADQLLYDAKRTGRNRFSVASHRNREKWWEGSGVSLDQVLRILESEALALEFQPIAEAETGHIVLAEGLVRVLPSEGAIPAGELVAAVERAGIGPVLDMWVIRRGISLLPELQHARPGFNLSLNLSAQSVGSEEVARLVISELEKHQVPPGSLVLEVTETTPIKDFEAARYFQGHLRTHGVIFAIDDFGAGIDPYRYLKELNFEILKIAGEFVQGMPEGGIDLDIVKSFVHLADEQGMVTVAEFVSDERVSESIRRSGITYAQGYHIGASLPLREFIATHLTGRSTPVTRTQYPE